ncbi:hypothetical protein MKX03_000332 [Papaver bracteatum]|nr:hypothetical protein MKX03_000332 [Papaver bracteatum]
MEKENQIIEMKEEDVAELALFDPSKKKKPVEPDSLIEENGDAKEDLDVQVKEDEEGEGIVLQILWKELIEIMNMKRYTLLLPKELFLSNCNLDLVDLYLYIYIYLLYPNAWQVLGCVFHILRENNPELAGDRYRPVMKPPQVLREGTKRTVLVNFMDFCKTMCRQPEHDMTFLISEMGTRILQRYHNEYVICNGYKSPNILSKENMHSFLICKKVESELLNEDNGDAIEDLEDQVKEDEEGEGIVLQILYPWEGTDRDYEYEELLGLVFNILHENNPELAGDRRRTVMRPPQVLHVGTKKIVFVNFMDLCKTMHRQPEHVM